MKAVAPEPPTARGIGPTKTGLVKSKRLTTFELVETEHLAQVTFPPGTIEVVEFFEQGVSALDPDHMSKNSQKQMMAGFEFVRAIICVVSESGFRQKTSPRGA